MWHCAHPDITVIYTSSPLWDPMGRYIARTHTHVKITHFPMRCIIRAWEAWHNRPSAFQVLMMHRVGKCFIFTWAWVLTFIPWPVRNIKAAMQKSHISMHPFSAWIMSWLWDKSVEYETRVRSLRLITYTIIVTRINAIYDNFDSCKISQPSNGWHHLATKWKMVKVNAG